jgi:hypothetical protein
LLRIEVIGKRVRGSLYIHRDAVSSLPSAYLDTLARTLKVVGRCEWNVVRFEPDTVGLLLYESFDEVAFPALLASTRVDIASERFISRSYAGAANPLILHRKELLIAPSDNRVCAWAALTDALKVRGLFRDPHLIGRRQAWENRLADAGVSVEDHALCPI